MSATPRCFRPVDLTMLALAITLTFGPAWAGLALGSGHGTPLSITRATVVFVWPDRAAADSLTKEGLREAVAADDLDRDLSEQLSRLRGELTTRGYEVVRHATHKARFMLGVASHKTMVDLSRQHAWRGVLVFCPRRPSATLPHPIADDSVLAKAASCP
jgi:hypothetical protein